MNKLDCVYQSLLELKQKNKDGITANKLSEYMNLDRSTVSRYLNKLYSEGKVDKLPGRPVKYTVMGQNIEAIDEDIDRNGFIINNSLDRLVGAEQSLQVPIQQAKAAMLYPPKGLHTLILGETGVGKSMFAEQMYQFSKENGVLSKGAPFIRFNCADYADNPQLVISQIFGVKKGAYTGAETDREGLLKKADGGIIFLDEIHRLSPQGQEILFTFIDKGTFRPVGETEKVVTSNAQIIAATTEDPQSCLLKTFTRRIPMTITLPPLKERSVEERYYLLEQFIKDESTRLGKSIYFNKNALISFLLYDCPNNIGQLKSDIQIACAKAFLNYKANGKDFILVEQGDLNNRVSKGLMLIGEHRDEINKLLANVGDLLRFSYKDNINVLNFSEEEEKVGEYFYDIIENKLEKLRKKGMDDKEISDILNIDIESYFKKYINELPSDFRREEITKIVDSKIVDIVEEILTLASSKLNRHYDEKVYFGLALHLQGSLERIGKGNNIYHPKLNQIRIEYADEFLVAMESAKIIDNRFNTHIPLDEIGYLTMFIAAKPYENNVKLDSKVGVLVIMHGNSTASSMVNVSNKLIGEEYVEALDMPLSMKAEKMFELAKNKIVDMDSGKGILLIVDMGSLTNFGKIISEETGIKIKTIDMATTLLVIEAGRKALNGRALEDIYNSCIDITRYGLGAREKNVEIKENLIITACFTGEGSAQKLKEILLSKLKNKNKVMITPLNILDKEEFYNNIRELKKKHTILGIVGTVNLPVDNVPFIPAPEILAGDGVELLEGLIDIEEDYNKITKSIDTQINMVDGKELVKLVRESISEIQELLDIMISHEVAVGISIHICFLIEKNISGGCSKKFESLNEFRNEFSKEFILIKQSLRKLELRYNINISDDELAFIVRMITENKR